MRLRKKSPLGVLALLLRYSFGYLVRLNARHCVPRASLSHPTEIFFCNLICSLLLLFVRYLERVLQCLLLRQLFWFLANVPQN